MSQVVGEAVYKIGFDLDKKSLSSASNSIKSTLSSALSETGKTAKKIGSSIATSFKVGAVAAVGAAASIGKAAVSSFADMEQLAGGVETLFKESSGAIYSYADEAYKTAGLSANQYMETVTSFSASLLQSLEGDTKKSAEYANRAVIDMADNANKMGTDISLIQNAYQGFAKQNYTMLDNLKLGYGGTQAEMKRLIKDASKLKDVQKKLGITVDANSISFGNIVNAISVMQEKMGIAGTTAKEASETISGSINAMKASWSNLLTTIADPGLGFDDWKDNVLPEFIETVKTVFENIGPVIETALGGIAELVSDIAPMIIKALPKLVSELLPVIIDTAYSIFNTLVEVAPDIINTIVNSIKDLLSDSKRVKTVVSGFVSLFVAVASAASEIALAIIPLIPEIIGQIVADLTKPENLAQVAGAFAILFGINVAEAIGQSILTKAIPFLLTTALPSLLSAIGGFIISTVIPAILSAVGAIGTAVVAVITSPITLVVAAIAAAVAAIIALIVVFWEPITEFFGNLFQTIGDFATSAFDTMGKMASGAFDAICKAFSGLASFFGSIFSNAWNAVKRVFSTGGQIFSGIVQGITAVFKTVVNVIISGINNVVAVPFNAINGALNRLRGISIAGMSPFGWLPSIAVPQIPHLATGGIVPSQNGGHVILAGEAGQDEWVVPESKMASLIEQMNARGAGGNITVNVYGTFATSTSEQRKVAEVIAQRLQEINKSRIGGF